MKVLFFIVIIFAGTVLTNAQLVQVSGYILQKGDSTISLPHASIVNKRTKNGYQSTTDGFYTILMGPGDTTEVSLVGYKTAKITLPAHFSGANYHKNVYLKDDVVILGDYTKYSITWQKFKEAFASIKVEEEVIYITMDKKANDRSPVDANPHVSLNGPISWLYNKLGRKAKEQNKLDELRQGSDPDMEYTRRITNKFVMDATQLPEDKVNDFLDYCYSDNYFYAYATEYDIKSKFISCLPGFKEKYNIPDLAPQNNSPAPADSIKTGPQ